jgi:hypothetical protein
MVGVDGQLMDGEQPGGRAMQRHLAAHSPALRCDLLKTPLPAGDHFYNRIAGVRYDFTASQFDQPVAYMDLPANQADAGVHSLLSRPPLLAKLPWCDAGNPAEGTGKMGWICVARSERNLDDL